MIHKVWISIIGVLLLYTIGYVALRYTDKIVIIKGFYQGKSPEAFYTLRFASYIFAPASYLDIKIMGSKYATKLPMDVVGLIIPDASIKEYRSTTPKEYYFVSFQKETQSDVMMYYDTLMAGWSSSGWNVMTGGYPPTQISIYTKPIGVSPFNRVIIYATHSPINNYKSNVQVHSYK